MAEGTSKKRKCQNENSENDKKVAKKFAGHWSQGLLSSMTDPDLIVESDDKMVVIKDKYPKAKYHFLVMPKVSIPNLKSLKPEHLDLLKHFDEKGRAVAERIGVYDWFFLGEMVRTSSKVKFRFGYHSVPSMSHLHMHVISQDFNSPCLKTKKHWNSFTSQYFVDSKEIIKMLEKDGKVHFDVKDYQTLLNQDLRCHVCERPQKNMPTLKEHIKTHDYSVD